MSTNGDARAAMTEGGTRLPHFGAFATSEQNSDAKNQLDAADELANAAEFLLRCPSGPARWTRLREALRQYDAKRGDA